MGYAGERAPKETGRRVRKYAWLELVPPLGGSLQPFLTYAYNARIPFELAACQSMEGGEAMACYYARIPEEHVYPVTQLLLGNGFKVSRKAPLDYAPLEARLSLAKHFYHPLVPQDPKGERPQPNPNFYALVAGGCSLRLLLKPFPRGSAEVKRYGFKRTRLVPDPITSFLFPRLTKPSPLRVMEAKRIMESANRRAGERFFLCEGRLRGSSGEEIGALAASLPSGENHLKAGKVGRREVLSFPRYFSYFLWKNGRRLSLLPFLFPLLAFLSGWKVLPVFILSCVLSALILLGTPRRVLVLTAEELSSIFSVPMEVDTLLRVSPLPAPVAAPSRPAPAEKTEEVVIWEG